MIDSIDIEAIDTEYFEIIEIKKYTLVLRSRNTGHFWCLLEQVYSGHRTFRISHKHKKTDPYHFQRNKPSILACCAYIQDHDRYHLQKNQEKGEQRLRRLGLIEGEELHEQSQKGRRERRVLQTEPGEKSWEKFGRSPRKKEQRGESEA